MYPSTPMGQMPRMFSLLLNLVLVIEVDLESLQLPKRTACPHRPHLARTPRHRTALVLVRRCHRPRSPHTHTPTTTTKALNVRQFPITWCQQDTI